MKLTNHRKDNWRYDDTHDGSVMNGTITVSEPEWRDIIKRIKRAHAQAKRTRNTYRRDALGHTIEWTLRNHADKKRVCLGVCATSLVAKWYKLPNYKHQNYVIERI